MKKYTLIIIFILNALIICAQCLDFTNLRGNFVTCTYGNYYNPYSHIGIIDNGSDMRIRIIIISIRTSNKIST